MAERGNTATEGFWDFSVRAYASPGVAEACLSLQDRFGADVNMLLYCCWIGGQLGRFEADLFAAATRISTTWVQHVVSPLRSARTWMKETGCTLQAVPAEACTTLREEIKSMELLAENIEQQALESLVSIDEPRADAAEQILSDVVANLVLYAGYSGFDISSEVRREFAVIIGGAFPDLDGKRIQRELEL